MTTHATGRRPLRVVPDLDLAISDARLRAFMPRTADARVVVVDIDEKTFNDFAEKTKTGCPVSQELSATPIELRVENGSFQENYKVAYRGGERYPHLERDATQPDLLDEIIKPHAH